jgi:hypothetical protein
MTLLYDSKSKNILLNLQVQCQKKISTVMQQGVWDPQTPRCWYW